MNNFVPNLAAKLALSPFGDERRTESQAAVIEAFDWTAKVEIAEVNPFSISPRGHDYTGLGCFTLGIDASADDFSGQLAVQRRLRNLGLLKPTTGEPLRQIYQHLSVLSERNRPWAKNTEVSEAVADLLELLSAAEGNEEDEHRIRVFIGLHSGFRANSGAQFWGIYDAYAGTTTDLFVSGDSSDVASTVLHTFLSSRGCTRAQCLEAEIALSLRHNSLDEISGLAPRIAHDIRHLSSAEAMLLLQRLVLSDSLESAILTDCVRAACEHQLMVVPTVQQLRAMNSTAYLQDEISVTELIDSRITWYRDQGCPCPDPTTSVALFQEVDERLRSVLLNRESEVLSQLEVVLGEVLVKDQIDPSADLFALAVFCAFRKFAVSEVYLEVLDRNPLPNAHTDQAACFAEMFALGSRCDSYFDMTPNAMGKILAQRYRKYYQLNQPPQRDDFTTELPTAYASKQIDTDPFHVRKDLPVYYQITFLGIFAVPALIDILLLTTLGRGLYVTAFMAEDEKTMATTALMIALLLCGSIGTWISAGGSYYLHSMAFAAMNMFVLTRLIAGIAMTLAGGFLAFIVIGIVKGFYAGIIFFLYFFLLTTYLCLLATLAIYQMPGFNFQSGRTLIMLCVPILLVPPIVTLWVEHDISIYLSFLATFTAALLFSARKIVATWGTWYLKIPCVTDTEVVDWYTKTMSTPNSEKEPLFPPGTDLASTPLPRQALVEAIQKERKRRSWQRKTSDEFVLKLVEGYESTEFLMDWYCRYSRTPMPYQFSPTWNLQCKAAVDTLRDMQKGLKLHSAFLHWRHAGPEVWCGMLYFVIALLDKWVAILTGGSVVGLSTSSEVFRLAVGFGLAYYLIGAVFLDAVGQPLWALANKKEPTPVSSLETLRAASNRDASANRKLYWTNLIKFLFLHLWGIAVTAALMWVFEDNRDATIMYVAYVGAYTGLLWYQYNRIFTGPAALKDLVIASIVGLIVGLPLRHYQREFHYSSVIALASATWTTALLSLRTSKILSWNSKREKDHKNVKSDGKSVFYSNTVFGTDPEFSQGTLSRIYDYICSLPADARYRVNPTGNPGAEVKEILMSQACHPSSSLVRAAFPSAEHMLRRTVEMWKIGDIILDLAPAHHPFEEERKLRSISCSSDGKLRILVFIGQDLIGNQWRQDIHRNCKIIAEAMVQAAAEARFGFPHEHSVLAELIVSDNGNGEPSVPEGVKRQMENSTAERTRIINNVDKELLRHLLLGLDCDSEWDLLPLNIRSFFLKRCCGEPCHVSDEQLSWIWSLFRQKNPYLTAEEFVARYNLGAHVAMLTASCAESLEMDCTYLNPLQTPNSVLGDGADSPSANLISKSGRTSLRSRVQMPLIRALNGFKVCLKFLVVSLVADPEFARELDYLIGDQPWIVRRPITLILNFVWLFCKALQRLILPYFLVSRSFKRSTATDEHSSFTAANDFRRSIITCRA